MKELKGTFFYYYAESVGISPPTPPENENFEFLDTGNGGFLDVGTGGFLETE